MKNLNTISIIQQILKEQTTPASSNPDPRNVSQIVSPTELLSKMNKGRKYTVHVNKFGDGLIFPELQVGLYLGADPRMRRSD